MRRAAREVPRLLVSARSLSGVTRAPRERMLEITARFHEPESLAVALSKALDAGAAGILANPSRLMRAALSELGRVVPLHAVLPDIPQVDLADLGPGVDGLLERRRKRVGSGVRWRMRLSRLRRLPGYAAGDMAARLAVLMEVEARALPRRGTASVVIASAITDLALATGNRGFFERAARYMRRRFHAAAGFETANLGVMLARLREWEGAGVDFVVGGINPGGLGMKPDLATTLRELESPPVPVIATELTAGGLCTLEQGVAFARQHGAHGLAPDLAEMDDVARELRAMGAVALPQPATAGV